MTPKLGMQFGNARSTPALARSAAFDFRGLSHYPQLATVRASARSAFNANSLDRAADREDFASNVAGRTSRGLLAEAALTLPPTHRDPGLILNGVVPGTSNPVAGLTRIVSAVDVPGYPPGAGARIQITGTPTALGNVLLLNGGDLSNTSTLHSAATGQTWSFQFYSEATAFSGVTTDDLLAFRNSTTSAGSGYVDALTPPANIADGVARYRSVTGASSVPGIAGVRTQLRWDVQAIGVPVNVDVILCGFNVYPGALQSPIPSGTTRAKDGLTLNGLPDGADADLIAIATQGQPTRSLTRAQLFAATGSRVNLPLGAGDLPNVGNIPAGGLEAGYRQQVEAKPG